MSFGWLWGANDVGEDQEVEHESGASRMGGAMCSVCCAPFVLIVAIILTGWNEKNSVCTAKAITEGEQMAKSVGCDSATAEDGNLIFFSCKYTHDGLSELSPRGDFNNRIKYAGTGLQVTSSMYQCIEKVSSQSKKDNVGGGKTKIKTYSYTKDWKTTYVNSGSFHNEPGRPYQSGQSHVCEAHNPAWPPQVPQSYTVYAPKVDVGAFKIGEGYVSSIPLDKILSTPNVPTGYSFNNVDYTTNNFVLSSAQVGSPKIGSVKISFKSSNGNEMVSVLGENKGGSISAWKASASWGCSGNTIGSLKPGKMGKDDFFNDMKSENTALTWILRLVGFLIFWCGFSMFFAPLEVFADCIPCIGPYLGDAISCITCLLSIFPACACFVLIAGILWVAMRPLVGIPMLAVFCICSAAGVAYKMKTGHMGGGKIMGKISSNSGPTSGGKAQTYGAQRGR
jgi:hypothetical protein